MKRIQILLVAVAALVALPAFAEGDGSSNKKAKCEADCEETSTICEETMLKKLGKENKAAVGQVKKICSDATKQCKEGCKK